ncbi:MAG: hypothetical protein Q4F38_09265 [Akkermansia sp.]|nr:hypothetical protein [Akkermansia sp.]
MNANAQRIKDYLLGFYPPEEWPTLLQQADDWAVTQPLAGLRVLDASPLFRNSLGKFMALLAAGAEVYVPRRTTMPHDAAISAMLPDFGIKTAEKGRDDFDIVLDCAAQCARRTPTLGYAELTRSGVPVYERTRRPVIVADDGRIKRVETTLGTGESFFRALNQLGYTELEGRRLLVVGYGKVGRGLVHYARKRGMRIMVADVEDKAGELPGDIGFVNVNDREDLNDTVLHAWCVVTATGRINALHNKLDERAVIASPVLLANMGIEDEYGTKIPPHRVLNNKKPLNFILDEPTRMCFIETTLALHNACALELLTPDLPNRCMPPAPDVEERLLQIATTRGTGELKHLHLLLADASHEK